MARSICGSLHLLLLLSLVANGVSKLTVRNLPGFSGALPFELETGYETVDESEGVEFFYYFVKSENNPATDPLFFWFVGGPGCAAINALVHEIGPLEYHPALYDGKIPTLVSNPYAWTKVASMVFVDHPVGAGFSYSTTKLGSASSDTINSKQAHTFIERWLADHPEFAGHDVYIGGDSYGGTTVPLILQEVTNALDAGNSRLLKLKGYVLGNPVTDRYVEENSQVPYSHGMALISDELYESAKKNCREEYVTVDPSNVACQKDMRAIKQLTKDLYEYDILERNCSQFNPTANDRRGSRRSFLEVILGDGVSPDLWQQCKRNYGNTLSYYWANDKRVQAALGVKKGTVVEWISCNQKGIHYQMNVNSSVPVHVRLSKRGGLRSLIYNGDHDLCVPFLGTQAWIRSLNYPISEDWRPWSVEGLIAGYTRTYTNNMTFATVKGGGHTAPEYKPKECLVMLQRWFSHQPL